MKMERVVTMSLQVGGAYIEICRVTPLEAIRKFGT